MKHPKTTETPIAAAIRMVQWPAWAPRPAKSETIECALPSVADVRQAPKSRAASRARATPGDGEQTLQERVALCKIIGNRLREARELAGFSQQEAAKELGYANSSKLAKIEGATDTNSVPPLTIRKAAELYEVSTDFLFGLTEDWDIPPGERHQRQIGRWLFDSWQVARERDLAALSDVSKAMSVVAGAATHLADGADGVQRAFDKVRDFNTNFDDLIGGARLQASIEALADAGRQARLQLRRLHLEIAGDGSGAGHD